MTPFERLHPALQHHIVNSLGWSSLRPLQEATIEPILAGDHAVLLAPTAGGKTEAAVFPVFSRMLEDDWHDLSVLYICPIKALLNNLESRLEQYGTLIGRRVGLWHGDVSPGRKNTMLTDPPDLLLTTPESIEVMLVSKRVDHRLFFANLQCVVVDEIHAFAGDDRGWHLLYLLERLNHLAGREVQRLGLSATVGNPDGLAEWLAGRSAQPWHVINPAASSPAEPVVEVDWVGNLRNAALVISRLHRGEKRLVFCDSRSRVEELSLQLRELGVATFVSHSSLSLEERRAAETAFSEGNDCVIVATSTLELGIDVGDLDRIIQIDAPGSVASFLQRIGRAGRRTGTARNCLFLTTKEESFLQCMGLMHLWANNFVEPVEPPPLPFHIFAQQIMALALQEGGIGRSDWRRWFSRLPGFEEFNTPQLEEVIDTMLSKGILYVDQGVLFLGNTSEQEYGRKNFLELFSVFVGPPYVRVLHGRQEIGEVHQSTFILKEDRPTILTLAGRSWAAKHVDWSRRVAFVEPTDFKGRSQWIGADQPLSMILSQAIVRAIFADPNPVSLTRRAAELLEDVRERFSWLEEGSTHLIEHDDGSCEWWTFAGKLANSALAIAIAMAGSADHISADNFSVTFKQVVDRNVLSGQILQVIRDLPGTVEVTLDADFVKDLKFGQCLSDELIKTELSARFNVGHELRQVASFTFKSLSER